MKSTTSDPLLRSSKAAEALGIHKVTLLRWIHTGLLPAIRLPGGEYRIRQSDIDLILAHGRLSSRETRSRRVDPKDIA